VILKTANSVYEVDTEAKRFRVVASRRANTGTPTLGRWQQFDSMTPAERGRRVRFSWVAAENGRHARIGFVDTSPVTAVEDEGATERVRSHRRRPHFTPR
jgi:hypothetical protein